MVLLLKTIYQGYNWLMTEVSDPRADNVFLGKTPILPISIGLLYLHLVFTALPKFMKDKPAYDLRNAIRLFNLVQIVVNLYMVVMGSYELLTLSNPGCALVDYSDSFHGTHQFFLTQVYFITKVLDLFDTIFFLLRKKSNQVTFLHVYHHFGMVIAIWLGVRFAGGGHSLYLGVINSFVHVCMYSYYFLSVYDDKYKRFGAAFKKYITQLQIIQFASLFVIYGKTLVDPSCSYPKLISFFLMCQASFFVMLFSDFYIKTYFKSKPCHENETNNRKVQ